MFACACARMLGVVWCSPWILNLILPSLYKIVLDFMHLKELSICFLDSFRCAFISSSVRQKEKQRAYFLRNIFLACTEVEAVHIRSAASVYKTAYYLDIGTLADTNFLTFILGKDARREGKCSSTMIILHFFPFAVVFSLVCQYISKKMRTNLSHCQSSFTPRYTFRTLPFLYCRCFG